jgi:hypothetical protein
MRRRALDLAASAAEEVKAGRVLGKYIISDRPMTEEEWIRERADVIDVTPEK